MIQDSTSQQKLCANVAAQIVAFACGKADDNRNKNFEGGRPSSIIIGDQLNPQALGALLAHFENKIRDVPGIAFGMSTVSTRKEYNLAKFWQNVFWLMRQTAH